MWWLFFYDKSKQEYLLALAANVNDRQRIY